MSDFTFSEKEDKLSKEASLYITLFWKTLIATTTYQQYKQINEMWGLLNIGSHTFM
jgi:hypothetical protein